MTRTRRIANLLGLTVAMLTGGMLPASATFSDSVALTTTVGTATIAPPTQVEAKSICTTTVDPVTLRSTTTVQVKIEWWRSTSPRVTGYRVTAYPAGGSPYTLTVTGPTDEVAVYDSNVLASNSRITVTSLTQSTWTAESGKSPVLPC
jgi:hypothetical protein